MKLALLGLMIFGSAVQAQGLPYSASAREGYIKRVMESLRQESPQTLNQLVSNLWASESQQCRSLSNQTALKCLENEGNRFCRDKSPRCPSLWDIVMVNKMNEKLFINKEERFRISQEADNFPTAFRKELRMRYGRLATLFLLQTGNQCAEGDTPCLAQNIDQYCASHADTMTLPWQACVAAIAWFTSTKP